MLTLETFWNNYNSGNIYKISSLPDEIQENIKLAECERKKAYAPYSKYSVGAVLVTACGTKVPSCNSETCNIDSICAEAGAISAWTRECIPDAKEIKREEIVYIAISGKPLDNQNTAARDDVFVTPCGRCRQRIYEHCCGDTIIVGCNETLTQAKVYKLSDLLPDAYTPKNLNQK